MLNRVDKTGCQLRFALAFGLSGTGDNPCLVATQNALCHQHLAAQGNFTIEL